MASNGNKLAMRYARDLPEEAHVSVTASVPAPTAGPSDAARRRAARARSPEPHAATDATIQDAINRLFQKVKSLRR
jgi:hypothetical protein